MKKNKYFLVGILLLISIALIACGNEDESESSSSESDVDKSFKIASGGTSGTYFPIAVAMSKVMSENTDYKIESQTTGGSIANLRMIDEGEVKMLFAGAITADAGYKGEDPFKKPIDSTRSITALYPETLQIAVPQGSGINSIEDLAGKKVAVGAPGSGTERTAKIILEAHGISYDDIKPEFLGFAEAVTSMKDNAIDSAFIMAGTPTSAIVDASSSMDIDVLSIEDDMAEKIIEQEPYLVVQTIEAGTYENINEDIVTLATPATLLVAEDVNEDTVYELTKSIFENLDKLQESHVQANNISLETATEGLSIPLHPGAIKYYEEQDLDVDSLK